MDSTLEFLSKSFTRYFIPGLIFVSFSLILPVLTFYNCILSSIKDYVSFPSIFALSLVFGYLLDSAGSYRLTLHYKSYKQEKLKLSKSLSKISANESNDPDVHISRLWIQNEKLYGRIFLERAEWVLILESAFALLCSSFISFVATIVQFIRKGEISEVAIISIFVLSFVSFFISRKGIQRMAAHNSKLSESLKSVYSNS